MADDRKTVNLVAETMKDIIEAVRRASAQDPTPITDIGLIIGLLETAGSLAAMLRMPGEVLELLVNIAFASAEDRAERFREKRNQEKDQPPQAATDTTPAPVPAPPSGLTGEQVREILSRLKEGGRVH